MKIQLKTLTGLLVLAATFSLSASAQEMSGAGGRVDRRKQTTVQTAVVDDGATKNAVTVRYLNLPWGEATFNYIETGKDPSNNGYYSSRTWPIAHLTLARAATHDGKPLAAGDYVIYVTPKGVGGSEQMTLSIASFKPAEAGGSFLRAGNVFDETPTDAKAVSQRSVSFAKGAPAVDHLQISLARDGKKDVLVKIHYGDRTLTEKLTLN
ncbi:MAG: hypothetical protein ACRD9R_21370 [Pyrinomonadaceae bacterium]